MKSCEQHARDILERMEIADAQNFAASRVIEIANLIAEIAYLKSQREDISKATGPSG